ncbi:hypothetical protein [Micromonospora echinofusca]|uniref:Excreted virulence factor EspC, type VII ESX diderm n=1 Tax=Micromonospora echinofusca TaxID=47858 RepID=A0ABS3VWM9_MICEH|nr:hypothetical protein [Micromonospora echinofusca]MBO4208940.1 hypothetical protein [Micromonospora echinofusca]
MGTYFEIDGDPNQVAATGSVLRAMAESLRAKSQGALGQINGIEGERPWGADKYGQAFESTYRQVPEGGDTPFSDTVKDGLGRGGEQLQRASGGVVRAMNDYQGVEAENEAGIRRSYRV